MFVRDIKSNEASLSLSLSLLPRSFAVRMLARSLADGYSDFQAKRLLYSIVADSRVNLNIYPQTNLNGELALCEKRDSTLRGESSRNSLKNCARSSSSYFFDVFRKNFYSWNHNSIYEVGISSTFCRRDGGWRVRVAKYGTEFAEQKEAQQSSVLARASLRARKKIRGAEVPVRSRESWSGTRLEANGDASEDLVSESTVRSFVYALPQLLLLLKTYLFSAPRQIPLSAIFH